MISLQIKVGKGITDINLNDAIQKSLVQSSALVMEKAKVNSPYMTGTLRGSITQDLNQITTGKAIVGTDVKYARVREYVNFKNPHTKFYMKRALSENIDKIKRFFDTNISNSLKK